MEQVSKITVLSKLNSDVKLLERELTNMANRLGALNQQVNDVLNK